MAGLSFDQARAVLEFTKTLDLDAAQPTEEACKLHGFLVGLQGGSFYIHDRDNDESLMGEVAGYLAGRQARNGIVEAGGPVSLDDDL